MKSPEEQLKDAQEAQTNLRAMVVAAGILTEPEAAQFIRVEVGDPADAPHGEHCTCGHDMSDATLLAVGIDRKVGEERFNDILTLLNSTGGSN
jgi:hypothetical protein